MNKERVWGETKGNLKELGELKGEMKAMADQLDYQIQLNAELKTSLQQ